MIKPVGFKDEVTEWAVKLRVKPKEIHVRQMTRKWASCSTRGRVTFSTHLLYEPKKRRDEVIVHELLHLRYPHHGKMFYTMMRSYLNLKY
jgi:predicted metal-dependent hydrolase